MGINLATINNKLNSWAKSSSGRAAINSTVKSYRKNGTRVTEAGSKLLTAAEVHAMANEFISLLASKAASSSANGGDGSIPPSVSALFSGLVAGTPVEYADGCYVVTISFSGDLSRPSLVNPDSGQPLGEGISNIVALFNNGANANGSVFGFWAGHGDLGPIWSRRVRPALGFMQSAKKEFEGKYGAEYGVEIVLGSDYE